MRTSRVSRELEYRRGVRESAADAEWMLQSNCDAHLQSSEVLLQVYHPPRCSLVIRVLLRSSHHPPASTQSGNAVTESTSITISGFSPRESHAVLTAVDDWTGGRCAHEVF